MGRAYQLMGRCEQAIPVPEFEQEFSSRVVLALIDADTGDGLTYLPLDSVNSIGRREVGFDSDGDLWFFAAMAGDINIGAQTTFNEGPFSMGILMEFSVSDTAMTYERRAPWSIGGQEVAPLELEMTTDGAYVSGKIAPSTGAFGSMAVCWDVKASPMRLC